MKYCIIVKGDNFMKIEKDKIDMSLSGNLRGLISITVVFITIIIMAFTNTYFKNNSKNNQIKKSVEEIKSSFPTKITDDITLNDINYDSKSNTIMYSYILNNISSRDIITSSKDYYDFLSQTQNEITNNVKKSDDLKIFKDNNCLFKYIYYDTSNSFLFQFTVEPAQYNS